MDEIMKHSVEIELGDEERKFFVLLDLDTEDIYIDFEGLPITACLCASFDSTPVISAKVGENGDLERTFVNVEWVINDWGGDKEIVEAIKIRKKMILDDLDKFKEEYSKTKD
ncbi:MAG TPA: hypothetical protein VMX17_02290 [Candidatus Glassbacteria bacterium]|nr:hypothetical protein [Candidatus Glassbacteria bacterium]